MAIFRPEILKFSNGRDNNRLGIELIHLGPVIIVLHPQVLYVSHVPSAPQVPGLPQ